MDQNNICMHEWNNVGLWDGVTSKTDHKTGGTIFECSKCKKRVYTLKELLEMGGTYKNKTVSEYVETEKKILSKFSEKTQKA